VGVDLGQSKDFTAIAAIERVESSGEVNAATFARDKTVLLRLRFLERVELGTPYPEVVERVVNVTKSRVLAGRTYLIVDGTGVGRPVVDLIRNARPGCMLMPAVITSGQRESFTDGYYGIPKRDLIVGLQVLLQQGQLRITSSLKYGSALAAELAAMEVKVTSAGREQFGAWREGTHDDLVFAVALACWGARKACPDPKRGDYAGDHAGRAELGKLLRGL
jgi:hypothetical protein